MLLTSEEIQAALEGELQRLFVVGLTQEQDAIARRYYSQKERESMDEGAFCGPHRSFPITSAEDVSNAAHLIGKADDPEAVKRCIIARANKNGWALPDAWKEDRSLVGALTRAANHDPMTGKHTHAHPAFGAQGDDGTHEHEHSHNNDNDHHHDHSEERALQASNRLLMSLPLMRIDATKREVWGQATIEKPDSYGTIFAYYPEAWKTWRGNIREQHDSKKAVGKRVELECDDLERAIYVGSRISRGAQDTWLKVEDDVLSGYSASVIPDPEFGTDPKRWPQKEYQGKMYPYLPRYSVAELSLVDNPACPGCNIAIVRADGFATDVLDTTDEEPTNTIPAPSSSPSLDRAGARLSADSRAALHEMRDKAMSLCGCDECQGMTPGEPDGDEDMERKITGIIERVLNAQLSPVYARLQGIAGTLARSNASSNTATLEAMITSAITRGVDASLSEVRTDLSAVKETVARIDSNPMPGAPIMNAGALPPRPVEKRLPTDPQPDLYAQPQSSGSAVADAMEKLYRAGQINTFDQQMEALTAGIILQQKEKARR